jgi:allantoin racemase
MNKILFINPVGTEQYDSAIAGYLKEYAQNNTEIDVKSFKKGPKHLEYMFYESVVGNDILRAVYNAEKERYDSAIIGCFYDPYLYEAREIVNIPVIGPAEASMNLASMLGYKFSIIVGRTKWIPQMNENIIKYNMSNKLASFESLGMGVLQFQQDPQITKNKIIQASRRALEKGAEVIILGCTIEYGFYKELQDILHVPILDVVLASLKYAEMMSDISKNMNWSHSKIGIFEPPIMDEIIDFNLIDNLDGDY